MKSPPPPPKKKQKKTGCSFEKKQDPHNLLLFHRRRAYMYTNPTRNRGEIVGKFLSTHTQNQRKNKYAVRMYTHRKVPRKPTNTWKLRFRTQRQPIHTRKPMTSLQIWLRQMILETQPKLKTKVNQASKQATWLVGGRLPCVFSPSSSPPGGCFFEQSMVDMDDVKERMRGICRSHPNGPRMPNGSTLLEMLAR